VLQLQVRLAAHELFLGHQKVPLLSEQLTTLKVVELPQVCAEAEPPRARPKRSTEAIAAVFKVARG
jgi:hypothetical protein